MYVVFMSIKTTLKKKKLNIVVERPITIITRAQSPRLIRLFELNINSVFEWVKIFI